MEEEEDMVAEDVEVVVVVTEVVVGVMTDIVVAMEDTTEIMEDIKCSSKSDFVEPVVSVNTQHLYKIKFYSLSQIQWLYGFLFLLLL